MKTVIFKLPDEVLATIVQKVVWKPEEASLLEKWIYEGEELKTETCTNVGTDYAEVDQFVCSKCGIELQDWHRVERDMDDGEVSYHEYTFHFCPHCGSRIVEGAEE